MIGFYLFVFYIFVVLHKFCVCWDVLGEKLDFSIQRKCGWIDGEYQSCIVEYNMKSMPQRSVEILGLEWALVSECIIPMFLNRNIIGCVAINLINAINVRFYVSCTELKFRMYYSHAEHLLTVFLNFENKRIKNDVIIFGICSPVVFHKLS